MSDAETLSTFALGLDARRAATVARLATVVGLASEPLDSAIKWRRLTYARDGEVDLIFHFGGILEDPDRRLAAGTSKFLRKLQFADAEDVQQELVLGFVEQAIDRLPYFRENWKAIQAGTLLE